MGALALVTATVDAKRKNKNKNRPAAPETPDFRQIRNALP